MDRRYGYQGLAQAEYSGCEHRFLCCGFGGFTILFRDPALERDWFCGCATVNRALVESVLQQLNPPSGTTLWSSMSNVSSFIGASIAFWYDISSGRYR
jgi:hypothetical protein